MQNLTNSKHCFKKEPVNTKKKLSIWRLRHILTEKTRIWNASNSLFHDQHVILVRPITVSYNHSDALNESSTNSSLKKLCATPINSPQESPMKKSGFIIKSILALAKHVTIHVWWHSILHAIAIATLLFFEQVVRCREHDDVGKVVEHAQEPKSN